WSSDVCSSDLEAFAGGEEFFDVYVQEAIWNLMSLAEFHCVAHVVPIEIVLEASDGSPHADAGEQKRLQRDLAVNPARKQHPKIIARGLPYQTGRRNTFGAPIQNRAFA